MRDRPGHLTLLWCLGVTFAPAIIVTTYLALAGPESQRSAAADLVVFVSSLLAGLGCIALLPLKMRVRIVLGLLYVPTMAFLLFVIGVTVVCSRYGDCM